MFRRLIRRIAQHQHQKGYALAATELVRTRGHAADVLGRCIEDAADLGAMTHRDRGMVQALVDWEHHRNEVARSTR